VEDELMTECPECGDVGPDSDCIDGARCAKCYWAEVEGDGPQEPAEEPVSIRVHYSDGNYSWSHCKKGEPFDAQVPRWQYDMWLAAAKLDRLIQKQLMNIDNEAYRRREGE
jgi:hypothetical protein